MCDPVWTLHGTASEDYFGNFSSFSSCRTVKWCEGSPYPTHLLPTFGRDDWKKQLCLINQKERQKGQSASVLVLCLQGCTDINCWPS